MKVTITNKDVTNLNKFMLIHSKKARKMRIMSFYAIPLEFILLGIILDGLLKKAPIFTISSAILAILWFVIFPKFYNKMVAKNIAKTENLNLNDATLNFICDEEKISFSPDLTPKASEIFYLDTLNRIVKTDENFFIVFSDAHIVLPNKAEISQEVENLSKKLNLQIENLQI